MTLVIARLTHTHGFFQKSYLAPLDINGENAFMALSEEIADQKGRRYKFQRYWQRHNYKNCLKTD